MFSLTDFWAYATAFLLTLYHQIRPVRLLSGVTLSAPPKTLPPDCLDLIFSFYVSLVFDGLDYGTVREYRTRQQHFMQELCKVARCSRLFNEVMMGCLRRVWASSGYCPSPCVRSLGASDPPGLGVRVITAESGFLPLNFSLEAYKVLEVASINCDRGAEWNLSERAFVRSTCITKYPGSLRQLELLRLHTPEAEVIRLVSDCCPGLTELRLVRCTMFNGPGCWYWRSHTKNQDHDYMQSYHPDAVVNYANRIALLLCGLKQLEVVHIGHYLVNIQAVLRHRTDRAHKRYHPIDDKMSYVNVDGSTMVSLTHFMAFEFANSDGGPPIDWNTVPLAKRELWKEPCPECNREFARPIETAERLAARILVAHSRSLKRVSFAGFLTDGRIRPSAWKVGCQQRGEDLHVWTEDPTRPRSREIKQMIHVNGKWQYLETQ